MEATAIRYEAAPAPKGAAFTCFNCARCGHEELGKPVFLRQRGTTGAGSAFGSGCAALLLYGSRSAPAIRRARQAQSVADRKHQDDLYNAQRIADLPPIAAGSSAEVAEAWRHERALYHRLGGHDALGSFFAWATARRDAAVAILAAG